MSVREVYADHAATTPLSRAARAAMAPWLDGLYGNASSVHHVGERAHDAIEAARGEVAALVNATPEEVVFTASGSEANNLALKGTLALAEAGRRRIVVSAIEHPSVLETARALAASGAALDVVPVGPEGIVDQAELARRLGPDVAIVSVMAVNNEIGTLQPIAELGRAARAAGARMHVDAVQAAGRLPLDFAALDAELLTLSGHKLGGPLGAAALVVQRRTRLEPLVHGGQQERGRRAGTEDVAAIVGFGAAAAAARAALVAGEPERTAKLGDLLLDGLLERVPGARLNGDRVRRWRGIVNVTFDGVDGEALLHELDREGVVISTGSACSSAHTGPSHVLLALGHSPEDAHASVRFSLGAGNDAADVARILEVVPAAVERLRELDRPAAAGGAR